MPRDAPSSTRRPASPTTSRPKLVTSGVSVGVPGTLATWQRALRALGHPVAGAVACARRPGWPRDGFVVDQTFHDQVAQNEERFTAFPATRRSSSCAAAHAAAGRQHASATRTSPTRTDLLARRGPQAVLRRPAIAARSSHVVRRPAEDREHRPAGAEGLPRPRDLARYRALDQDADRGRLPRARRLRHGAVLARRLDGRRGAQHPRALPTWPTMPATPTRCTATSRPARSPSPTAAPTSATRRTSTCRCEDLLSDRSTPPSGAA